MHRCLVICILLFSSELFFLLIIEIEFYLIRTSFVVDHLILRVRYFIINFKDVLHLSHDAHNAQ